jgi:hypothetical protein
MMCAKQSDCCWPAFCAGLSSPCTSIQLRATMYAHFAPQVPRESPASEDSKGNTTVTHWISVDNRHLSDAAMSSNSSRNPPSRLPQIHVRTQA